MVVESGVMLKNEISKGFGQCWSKKEKLEVESVMMLNGKNGWNRYRTWKISSNYKFLRSGIFMGNG